MCPIILRNCEGLWDNPFSPCKIIRRKQNGLVLKTKSKQITEKENRNRNEKGVLPGLAQHGPAHWPGASHRLPLPVGRGGTPRHRRARHASSCLPPTAWSWLETPRPPRPSHSSHSVLMPSPVPLARTHPSATAAAARRSHGHRPPHASPTRPEAPPLRPPPPHRATPRRKPPNVLTELVSNLPTMRSPPPPRPLLFSPELAVRFSALAVSH